MKKLTIFLWILNSSILFGQTMDVRQLRSMYYKASQKSAVADQFYDQVKSAGDRDPLLLGYKGMSEFMKCYHSFNPVNKLSYFYKGKADLDHAIRLAPDNIELRFLRFTVQSSAPSFLRYNGSLQDDKDYLIRNLKQGGKDIELEAMIKKYMVSSGECSVEEKAFFNSL